MKRIDAARLRAALVRPAGPYAELDVVASTGSTNADLREALVGGADDRTVLIAEEQTAGQGRRGRTWVSPSGSGLYCSVLLRPSIPLSGLGSLAPVAGLAVLDALRAVGVEAVLKWPNDVLAPLPSGEGYGKCAGILSEAAASDEQAVILGMGLNVKAQRDPVPPAPGGLPAVSLSELANGPVSRTAVALALLTALDERERRWRADGGDLGAGGLISEYLANCVTIGHEVKIMIAGAPSLVGEAVDLDPNGALIVRTAAGELRTIFAGDVVHLRPVAE